MISAVFEPLSALLSCRLTVLLESCMSATARDEISRLAVVRYLMSELERSLPSSQRVPYFNSVFSPLAPNKYYGWIYPVVGAAIRYRRYHCIRYLLNLPPPPPPPPSLVAIGPDLELPWSQFRVWDMRYVAAHYLMQEETNLNTERAFTPTDQSTPQYAQLIESIVSSTRDVKPSFGSLLFSTKRMAGRVIRTLPSGSLLPLASALRLKFDESFCTFSTYVEQTAPFHLTDQAIKRWAELLALAHRQITDAVCSSPSSSTGSAASSSSLDPLLPRVLARTVAEYVIPSKPPPLPIGLVIPPDWAMQWHKNTINPYADLP